MSCEGLVALTKLSASYKWPVCQCIMWYIFFLLTQTLTLSPPLFHITDIPRGDFQFLRKRYSKINYMLIYGGGTIIIFLKIDSSHTLYQEYKNFVTRCTGTLLIWHFTKYITHYFYLFNSSLIYTHWVRRNATSRMVDGLNSDEVIGFFSIS
jgi:hypothetical protein